MQACIIECRIETAYFPTSCLHYCNSYFFPSEVSYPLNFVYAQAKTTPQNVHRTYREPVADLHEKPTGKTRYLTLKYTS